MGIKGDDILRYCWEEFEIKATDKHIVCYGAGVNASLMLMKEIFRPYLDKVSFFVDKDKGKAGNKIVSGNKSYIIKSVDALDEIEPDTIILVTIADYITTGKMLDEKGLIWFPWTVISSDFSISKIKEYAVGSEKKYYLLNTPDYMNAGDHAIALAEKNYLVKNFGSFFELGSNACHKENLRELSRYVNSQDVIFIQGGGNMGSLWRVCEENIRNIIKTFPENKIVVFPQSVFYGNSEEELLYFRQSKDIYNSHKDLLICSRDRRSYEFVNNSYKCKSMLVPDMVLTLEYHALSERRGIGVLLRNDKEKNIDSDYQLIVESAVCRTGKELKIISHHPIEDPCRRETIVKKLLEYYSSCEVVITDRLHGMIFSVITDTPCIVFDNSYHKISDLYKTWLNRDKLITLSEPVNDVHLAKLIEEKIKHNYSERNSTKYIKEFDKLTEYIKSC